MHNTWGFVVSPPCSFSPSSSSPYLLLIIYDCCYALPIFILVFKNIISFSYVKKYFSCIYNSVCPCCRWCFIVLIYLSIIYWFDELVRSQSVSVSLSEFIIAKSQSQSFISSLQWVVQWVVVQWVYVDIDYYMVKLKGFVISFSFVLAQLFFLFIIFLFLFE